MVLYPHFQQGTGLTLRIKATLLSVHTSGALSVLVTSHAIDSPAYTGRISMPMIRSPSSMDLSRTILSPPYHSPAQRAGSEYQVRNNSAPDISCRWFVF